MSELHLSDIITEIENTFDATLADEPGDREIRANARRATRHIHLARRALGRGDEAEYERQTRLANAACPMPE